MFEGMDRDEILKAHAGKVIMTVGKKALFTETAMMWFMLPDLLSLQ